MIPLARNPTHLGACMRSLNANTGRQSLSASNPSQITSAAMVGFGANLRTVVAWQSVSIVVWGTIFAALAHVGMVALS